MLKPLDHEIGREQPRLLKPDNITKCMECGQPFSMMRKKYSCRACGIVSETSLARPCCLIRRFYSFFFRSCVQNARDRSIPFPLRITSFAESVAPATKYSSTTRRNSSARRRPSRSSSSGRRSSPRPPSGRGRGHGKRSSSTRVRSTTWVTSTRRRSSATTR